MAKVHFVTRRGAREIVRNSLNLGLWAMHKRFRKQNREHKFRHYIGHRFNKRGFKWWWRGVRPVLS